MPQKWLCIIFRRSLCKVSWSITMFSSLLLNPGTYKKYSKYKLSDKQGSQSSEEELTCRSCEAALHDKTWGIFWITIKPICEQIKLQTCPDTRYVVKNEFSYCTSCYELLFSETCRACDTIISAGEKVRNRATYSNKCETLSTESRVSRSPLASRLLQSPHRDPGAGASNTLRRLSRDPRRWEVTSAHVSTRVCTNLSFIRRKLENRDVFSYFIHHIFSILSGEYDNPGQQMTQLMTQGGMWGEGVAPGLSDLH